MSPATAHTNPTTASPSDRTANLSCNLASNRQACNCTYEPCERKGVCCNCVRNHWTEDGTGRVACMK